MIENKKSQVDTHVVLMVLLCLTAIEICALMNGINGTLMTIVIGIMAAIAGVAIPKEKFIK